MESYLNTFQSYAPKKNLFSNIAGAELGEENAIFNTAQSNYNSLLSAYKTANAIRQQTDTERKQAIQQMVTETTLGLAGPAALKRGGQYASKLLEKYRANQVGEAENEVVGDDATGLEFNSPTQADAGLPEAPVEEPLSLADDEFGSVTPNEFSSGSPFNQPVEPTESPLNTTAASSEDVLASAAPEAEAATAAGAEAGAEAAAAGGSEALLEAGGEAAIAAPEIVVPLAIAGGLAIGAAELFGNNPVSDFVNNLFGGGSSNKSKPAPKPPPLILTRQLPSLSAPGRMPTLSGATQY